MTDTIDLNDAQWLSELPAGDVTGLACRTQGGQWYFLPTSLLSALSAGSLSFVDLAKNLDATMIWYPKVTGLSRGWSSIQSTPGFQSGATIRNSDLMYPDGVMALGGPNSTTYDDFNNYLSYLAHEDRNGLWNGSSFSVFHIDSLSDFISTANTYYRLLLAGGGAQNDFGLFLTNSTTAQLKVVVGSALRTYSLPLADITAELSDGWNHSCVQYCQDDPTDLYYKVRLYINGTMVAEFEETGVDALSEACYGMGYAASTTNIRADIHCNIAVCSIFNRALSAEEQGLLMSTFKSENNIS